MDRTIERGGRVGGRGGRGSRRLGLAALVVGVLGWLAAGGLPRLEAQAPRGQAGRTRVEYRQAEAFYTAMAETANAWEARGWETFAVVPVQAANPGVGETMKVVLLFRRPMK